jgi:mono/diheme cytochrome c family protein
MRVWNIYIVLTAMLCAACSMSHVRAPSALTDGERALMIADGRAIAETQCATCHAKEGETTSPNPEAPPLRYVLSSYNGAALTADFVDGLRVAHAPMPVFHFNPVGADSLLEYLESIRRPQPE